ncbi:hypothetical protein, partial [Mesorhizobium sp. M7A.F.Ca.CA.002.09.1.1]|uniref:hypothetical protein n=1 Tax=Mesorhizobium sp. M7A.F.Ca.CA.002.09.1.1 TaxID=2496739 RepID=UPI0019D12F5C
IQSPPLRGRCPAGQRGALARGVAAICNYPANASFATAGAKGRMLIPSLVMVTKLDGGIA